MEQLFHAWRLFHFEENGEIIDAYVQGIIWVVDMLNYGKNLKFLKCLKHYTLAFVLGITLNW